MPHSNQDEERRQHDELALGEVDRLRGLPQQREPDRHQRVDGAGGEARNQELEDVGQHAPSRAYLPSFGSTLVIFCWPLTTSARKLMRSISPLSSQVVSIRMFGSSFGVMVRPCMAFARPWRSNFLSFCSVTYLIA